MSAQDKAFAPTPGRLVKAKREGNVARSPELCGIVAFGTAILATCGAVSVGGGAAIAWLRESASHPDRAPFWPALGALVCAALAPVAAAATSSVATTWAQGGGLWVTAVKLDLAKLSPAAGLKRMVGGEAVVGVARATLAFAAALGAMIPLAGDVLAASTALASPAAAAQLVAMAALRAAFVALAVGGVFAVADYALARRRWLRGLRMTFEEMKRETKEHEGDPQARARRKSLHRALVRGAISRTREASFVVVNPTHVAIALRYAPPAIPVPEILVRAADDAALRVKEIAREHAIPIVEDVALARLLFASGEPGRAIPQETFVAVAQIIASLAREGVLT